MVTVHTALSGSRSNDWGVIIRAMPNFVGVPESFKARGYEELIGFPDAEIQSRIGPIDLDDSRTLVYKVKRVNGAAALLIESSVHDEPNVTINSWKNPDGGFRTSISLMEVMTARSFGRDIDDEYQKLRKNTELSQSDKEKKLLTLLTNRSEQLQNVDGRLYSPLKKYNPDR